jgi:hypothetical protein
MNPRQRARPLPRHAARSRRGQPSQAPRIMAGSASPRTRRRSARISIAAKRRHEGPVDATTAPARAPWEKTPAGHRG